jgi:hypothetical protein
LDVRADELPLRTNFAIDVKRVGRELGVRYVLEGSANWVTACGSLRITGQLIDATNAAHIWAGHYVGLAHSHFYAGRYEQASLAANRAAQANPQFTVPWVLRTASLANLGHNEELQASVQRLLELWPGVTIKGCLAGNFTSTERLAMLGERYAGPEYRTSDEQMRFNKTHMARQLHVIWSR